MTDAMRQHLAASTAQPVPQPVADMATRVKSGHADALAIVAYGSAFRDADPETTLIDLYVLTETVSGVSTNALARLGCALVPPNVYYAECASAGRTYRAKYAVLPLAAFEQRVGRSEGNPYFWARFAQPCRVVWARDAGARTRVVAALAQAAETAWANAAGLAPAASPEAAWTTLFRNTYRTELRPEAEGRAGLIVAAAPAHYAMIATAAAVPPVHASWAWRRVQGKALSVLRLLKAALTFQGGADYIAWKIERHSGVAVPITPWQRRHPVLAAVVLLPRLLRRGAVK